MEGGVSISAGAIWTALAAAAGLIIAAVRWSAVHMGKKDDQIAALQAEIKQKLQDDIDFYRRIEAEKNNV